MMKKLFLTTFVLIALVGIVSLLTLTQPAYATEQCDRPGIVNNYSNHGMMIKYDDSSGVHYRYLASGHSSLEFTCDVDNFRFYYVPGEPYYWVDDYGGWPTYSYHFDDWWKVSAYTYNCYATGASGYQAYCASAGPN